MTQRSRGRVLSPVFSGGDSGVVLVVLFRGVVVAAAAFVVAAAYCFVERCAVLVDV